METVMFHNATRRSNMGGLVSYLFGGAVEDPNLDVEDPVSGLTPRQKKVIVDSWAVVKTDIKGNGIALLILFFKTYPKHQLRFKAFATVPLEELKENKKLHAHSASVMYALTSVVDNLDDTGTLVEMLAKLGENHARRNITEQEFKDLKLVVIMLLKHKFGKKLTPFGLEAWDKALDVVNSGIFQGMKATDTSTTKKVKQ